MARSETPSNNEGNDLHREETDEDNIPSSSAVNQEAGQTNNVTNENQQTVTFKQIVDAHHYLAQRLRIWHELRQDQLREQIQSIADAMVAENIIDGYVWAVCNMIAADLHKPERRRHR